MALSEREQQVLRDLEKQLHADDPSLAGSMRPAGGGLSRGPALSRGCPDGDPSARRCGP